MPYPLDLAKIRALGRRFESIIQVAANAGWVRRATLVASRDAVLRRAGHLGGIARSAHRIEGDALLYNTIFDYVISFLNFLADEALRDNLIRPAEATAFLDALAADWEGTFLRALDPSSAVLQGPPLNGTDSPNAGRVAVTMISLWKFQHHYADDYGRTHSRADRRWFWDEARAGTLDLPDHGLELDGSNHCVWFVDEDVLSSRAGGGGRIHADRAYDLIGLDWRDERHWQSAGSDGLRAKALLIRCPLAIRRRAVQGLRVPTAIDAWGGLLWVPRDRNWALAWPHGGGLTQEPAHGTTGVAEGVHGPLNYRPPHPDNPVRQIGEVSGSERSDIVGTHGRALLRRALKRLKDALRPRPDDPDTFGTPADSETGETP